MIKEIWKDIKNFKGRYKISNHGRVYSLLSKKILIPDVNSKSGYCRVTLLDNEKNKIKFLVHRLVALHFIDNFENKSFVNHIDNNTSNNYIKNLEWVTHSENMIHAEKQGRLFEAQSKGGTIAGIKQTTKAIERHLSEIGNVYGNMLILALTENRASNGKMLLNVECLNCNSTFLRPLNYLKIRKPLKCPNC